MSTLTVGTDDQFATIAAAVAASQDGDIVMVDAGTYTNDFTTVNTKILLQGVGGMVHMVATETPPDGKAIMTTNTDTVIDHFEFSGAAVPDMNGAGIRYQGGNLTLTNTYFHDNQNGLLGNADPDGRISIRSSEFSRNGSADGLAHNIYVGDIATLNIQGSYFHESIVGHEIKSRAEETVITDSRIAEGPNGTGSYSVDVPNGGRVIIANNVIEQGPKSENPAIIDFGSEGNLHANSSLEFTNNTVLNNLDSSGATLVLNGTDIPVSVTNNAVYGLTEEQLIRGPGNQADNTILETAPDFDYSSAFPGTTPVDPLPPAPQHLAAVLGTGPDSLVIKVSETAYQGNAQFTIRVDGQLVSDTPFTASALHGSGALDTVTVNGNWGAGSHAVEVTFLNDAWGGTPETDRNLYVEGITLNGATVPGSVRSYLSAGSHEFIVPTATTAVGLVHDVGTGPDALVLQLSQDAFQDNARYSVTVDGKPVEGIFTAGALHGQGAHDTLTVHGDWAVGGHEVAVNFLNDAWGGTPGTDRNLYVDSVSYNGVVVPDASAALYSPGPKTLTFEDMASSVETPDPVLVDDSGMEPPVQETPTGSGSAAPGPGFDVALLERFTQDGVVDYGALAASLADNYDNSGVWFG